MQQSLLLLSAASAPIPATPFPAYPPPILLTLASAPAVHLLQTLQFADSIGLPTDEGLFGFRPFAEQWCGRLAMMGFVVSIVEEAMTGRGTLAQIGFETPSPVTLALVCGVFGTATLVGTADTVRKLVTRSMTPRDIAR
jgi:hypothetical protein